MDVHVNVIPGSDEDKIIKYDKGGLDIQVKNPDLGGKTNETVAFLIARALNHPEGDVKVVSGFEGSDKKVYIRNLGKIEIIRRLDLGAFESSVKEWETAKGGRDKSKKRSIRSKKKKRVHGD